MKKLLLIIACLFIMTINANAIAIKTGVTLESCIDGDTALFNIEGKETKVRFLAINTPEKDTDKYGKEASDYTCNILENAKEIIVEYDSKATKDKYERSLVWVWVDGKLLEEELIKEGYAEVAYIYDDYKYTESLCLIQNNAIKEKKNIWAEGKEEDYCAKVDINKVINIISYEAIKNDINYSDDDIKKAEEEFQKTTDAIERISNITTSVSNYLNDNNEQISNVLFYVILGGAGLYLLLQTIKKLK